MLYTYQYFALRGRSIKVNVVYDNKLWRTVQNKLWKIIVFG